MKSLLGGAAKVCFVIAALSFFWAEMWGIGIAIVTGALGFVAKNAADDLGEGEDLSE
jgi:hypothetical protein